MAEEEARRQAKVEFGNVRLTQERFYLNHRLVWFDHLLRDVGFAMRQLIKNPGFAATAILVLALGITATVAIFAFVDAALIRPLPFADPQRLVHVTESERVSQRVNISYLDYQDWKRLNTVFSSLDAFTDWNFLLSAPAGAEPVRGELVTSGFFRTLGVAPVLGRDFFASEEIAGAPNSIILSYATWQRRFGGEKNAIGQSVDLGGTPYTIIGVLPQDFVFAPGGSPEFWAALQPVNDCEKHRDCHNLFAIGRLKDGVSVPAALANTQAIARQLELQYPYSNHDRGASVMRLSDAIVGEIRPVLMLLFGGAGLLLLIACVNVSSLLVVRSESRKREIAVRGALGASRSRLICQFVTEGAVLVSGGLLAGLALANVVMQILQRLLSPQMMASMPYLKELGMNVHVFLFTLVLGVFALIVFSATLVLHLLSFDMGSGLAEGGRSSSGTLWRRIGGRLVVVELATTMVLLTGAGLLGKSLYRLLHVDLGFPADHLATLSVRLPDTPFPNAPQKVEFGRRLINHLETVPGIRAAAVTSRLPVSCDCNSDWVRIAGKPYDGGHITANQRDVSAGFFATLQTKMVAGRTFTDAEDSSKPNVVVINRTFARKYFPGQDPVGQQIGDPALSPSSMKQIIGVIEDFKDGGLDGEQWPAVYYPFNQDPSSNFSLIVRTSQDEQATLPALAASIRELNRDVGIEALSTMNEQINNSAPAYFHRSTAYLVGAFAALALVLSTVGLYGVIAYSTSRRTKEIGIRMALGAQKWSVQQMVFREASWLAAIGIAIGWVCSAATSSLMRGLLFGVQAWDVATLLGVAILLVVSALAASYIPAHRAASVNPVQALRAE